MAGSTTNVAVLEATLIVSPQAASDGQFPSSVSSIPFTLNTGPESKPAPVQTGVQFLAIDSPGSFLPLGGVGAGAAVPEANTLYLRTDSAIDVRTTTKGSVVAVQKVTGVLLIEVDDDPIVLLEAKGSGSIEWIATGDAPSP